MKLEDHIRNIPDYPKPGIQFKDITSLLKEPVAFSQCIDELAERIATLKPDVIAGIESRGFIVGSALAYKLNCAFVPIRKKGKLPAECISESYELEYGTDQLEIHKDAIKKNQRVILVDDLIATGGTALASARLIRRLDGDLVGCAFVIALSFLPGLEKLQVEKIPAHYLVDYKK